MAALTKSWFVYEVFATGDTIIHNQDTYECAVGHVRQTDREPGQGANWQTYWTKTTSGSNTPVVPVTSFARFDNPASGRYITHQGGFIGQGSHNNGVMHFMSIDIEHDITVNLIGVQTFNIPAASGAVVRFGIYGATADGNVGALVLDAGTVAVDVSSGIKSIVINKALPKGRYYLVAVYQGSSGSLTTAVVSDSDYPHWPTQPSVAMSPIVTGVTGALPATVTPVGEATATPSARVFLKVA